MSDDKKHEVKVTSALVGNLIMAAIVVIILGSALVYREFFD